MTGLSRATVSRLPRYLRLLDDLRESQSTVSSGDRWSGAISARAGGIAAASAPGSDIARSSSSLIASCGASSWLAERQSSKKASTSNMYA